LTLAAERAPNAKYIASLGAAMEGPVDQPVDVFDHLRAFARRWIVVVICLALAGTAAMGWSAMSAKQYQTTLKFIVVDKAGSANTQNAYQGSLLSQQLAGTFAELVGTTDVAHAVAERLPAAGDAAEIQSRVTGDYLPGTNLFTASVTDTSPQRALALAKALATVVPAHIAKVQSTRGPQNSPVVVKIAETPRLPTTPISPRPLRNLAVGLVLGLLAAITTVLALERFDTSTRSSAQIGTAIDLPVLGEVALWRTTRRTPVTGAHHSSRERVEAFRRLRARLLNGDPPSIPASVAIVSARSREGRSSTAVDLGIALAAAGSSVLIVDADLRRRSSPGVAEYFGIENESGLFNMLTDDVEAALVIWSCLPMLGVLPSGKGSMQGYIDSVRASGGREAGPRLESLDITAVLKSLEVEYDVVIVDTPPLLSRADGLLLASLARSTILVAQRGETSLGDLRKAAEDLRSVGASVRGVLVTFASGRPPRGKGRRPPMPVTRP
jgi:non-specific protein-tyrosine kinase